MWEGREGGRWREPERQDEETELEVEAEVNGEVEGEERRDEDRATARRELLALNQAPWTEGSWLNSIYRFAWWHLNDQQADMEIVFELSDKGLTAVALKRVCEVDRIIRTADIPDQFWAATFNSAIAMPSQSLGAFFANIQGKLCSQLTDSDVEAGIAILKKCAPSFWSQSDKGQQCFQLGEAQDCPPYACSEGNAREWTNPFPTASSYGDWNWREREIFEPMVNFDYLCKQFETTRRFLTFTTT